MSTTKESFYERYWSKSRNSIPAGDPTTGERKHLLASCLERFLMSGAGSGARSKILDAGCGDGEFVSFLQAAGFAPTGVDISQAAVQKARQQYPAMPFFASSLETTLPFADGEFAAVWSTEVLEHVFDVHACLAELNRVLADDGLLILTTPFHGLCKNLLIALLGFEKHYDPYVSHIRFFTKKSLTVCLTRAGLRPILWRGIGRFHPFHKSFFVVSRKVGRALTAPEITG